MLLLDTQVVVWIVADSRRLTKPAASAIRRARRNRGLAVSAITMWELAWLLSRRKIQSYGTIEATVRLMLEGLTILPITLEIAALAAQFSPDYPSDPADRLIGATALAEGLSLVTSDERIRRSSLVKTVW